MSLSNLGTRVRTFWQDQRAAFARLVARDPSINREATAIHYAAVFRRERDEALAEVERQRRLREEEARIIAASPRVIYQPTPEEIRRAFDNDLEAGAMFEWNVGQPMPRPFRTRPTTYRDTEQEDL